jgi:hypothetical protein
MTERPKRTLPIEFPNDIRPTFDDGTPVDAEEMAVAMPYAIVDGKPVVPPMPPDA